MPWPTLGGGIDKGEGKRKEWRERGNFSERPELGLIYISSLSSAWDSPHLLAPTLAESENCYF